MNILDIIRLMCIKIGKLEKIPRWRFLYRKNLEIKIIKLYNDFLKYDMYDKASAISVTLIQFRNSKDLLPKDLSDTISINPASIKIRLNNSENDEYNNSIVTYTPKISEFIVSYSINNTEITYTVAKNIKLSKKYESSFNSILDKLDDIYFNIIIAISFIINYHSLDESND